MKTKAIAVEIKPSCHAIYAPLQLSAYLRALRKMRGLTQVELGKRLGVTRARVSEIERDPAHIGFAQLQRILHMLGGRLVLEVPVPREPPQPGSPDSFPRGEW